MGTKRCGFAPILVVLIVVAGVIILGGVLYFVHKGAPAPVNNNPPVVASSTTPTSTPTSTASSSLPITSYRSYLTPVSGSIGTVVTIHASGFSPTGNVVTLNGLSTASLKDLSSPDGKTIMFNIPPTLGPVCNTSEMCAQFLVEVTPGTTYTVDVVAGNASVSQAIGTFTVTGVQHLPM